MVVLFRLGLLSKSRPQERGQKQKKLHMFLLPKVPSDPLGCYLLSSCHVGPKSPGLCPKSPSDPSDATCSASQRSRPGRISCSPLPAPSAPAPAPHRRRRPRRRRSRGRRRRWRGNWAAGTVNGSSLAFGFTKSARVPWYWVLIWIAELDFGLFFKCFTSSFFSWNPCANKENINSWCRTEDKHWSWLCMYMHFFSHQVFKLLVYRFSRYQNTNSSGFFGVWQKCFFKYPRQGVWYFCYLMQRYVKIISCLNPPKYH